jgi:hypothetical protein
MEALNEVVVAYLRYCLNTYLDELTKTTKQLRDESLSSVW